MKKFLMAIGQLVLIVFWFSYILLIKIPVKALKRRKTEQKKLYLERPMSDDYRFAVTKLAYDRTNQRFLNDSNEHAKLVARLMVSRVVGGGDVLIYSDSLKPGFYAEILCYSKCHFRIIVGNTAAVEVIRSLPQEAQNRIEFRASNTPKRNHFLVAGNSFRSEISDCSDELQVVCNFCESEVVEDLRNLFGAMWEKATPWPPH